MNKYRTKLRVSYLSECQGSRDLASERRQKWKSVCSRIRRSETALRRLGFDPGVIPGPQADRVLASVELTKVRIRLPKRHTLSGRPKKGRHGKGYWHDKKHNRFIVRPFKNGKRHHVACCKTEEEAIKAVANWRIKNGIL